jgi:peptidoglycan/LPS O-acetylase OafA/YrhL
VQLFVDVHRLFDVAENNLYKPTVHSIFYVLGFVYFSSDVLRRKWVLAASVVCGLVLSVGLVALFRLRVDYVFHTFSPDVYYVSGSLAAIAALLLLQPATLRACRRLPSAGRVLDFMHRYTFPIFLLHACAIYLTEELLGLVHPTGAYVLYGMAKFTIVLASTCVMSIPFGYLSDRLTDRALDLLHVRKG